MVNHATGLPLCQFSATSPLDCHSDHLSVIGITSCNNNLVKYTPVAEIQDRKGTPFELFPRVLSTNQSAGFSALDQSEASISTRFPGSVESKAIQSSATLPLECHSDQSSANAPNFMPVYANGLPLGRQCPTLPLHCHWNHSSATR